MVDIVSYRLGRGSLEAASRIAERVMPGLGPALLYLERLDESLLYELAKWKRRMLVARLAGRREDEVEPPVSIRPLLAAALVRARLLVSDEELAKSIEVEVGEP